MTHGTLTLAADGGFSYAPEPDFTGSATFSYRARDAFGNVSNTATATITVTQVNRPPVAEDDAYAITRSDTLIVAADEGVLANDTDPDGDTLTANSNTATATITVRNGLPIAMDDSYATVRDSTLRRNAGQGVLANDIGVVLTAILVDDVEEGDLTLRADGSFTYESDDDFLGNDVFTYRARDAFGSISNIATVTINIARR